MEKEIWKDVVGYEGLYQVSNMGNVRSLDRIDKVGRLRVGRLLKPATYNNGYKRVMFSYDTKEKSFLVHRLVAEAFIDNPNNYPIINHKDENPSNNRVENLEWCTVKYNNNYGTVKERIKKANINHPNKSKQILQYTLDGEFLKEYPSAMEVERQIGFRQGCISRVCRGERKSTGGFIWRYKKE